jgi:beta-N-acetylhexosaminidase
MGGIDPGLRRTVLSTLLAAFRGPQAPDWALDLVADGLAGHVLFGFNVQDAPQLSALTASLRQARPDVLIGIDEEGGDVTRLGHRSGSPYPGNGALGATGDPELTAAIYRSIGADLAAVGVNVNLAPSVDVNSASDNPIIGTRSFGADPALVSAHAAAAVRGLQESGVAACAKHFPGHGATVADSHLELPTVDVTLDVLRERDLPPFAAAIAAGTRSIMSAHIRVPSLTGDMPATFSRRMLTELLRDELGFTGAIVTDALEMQGAAKIAGGTPRTAVPALLAGADLLCIGADVDAELVELIVAEVIAAVRSGDLPLRRLEEASARALELAKWASNPAGSGTPDFTTPAGADLGLTVARRAVTVEGTVPDLADAFVVQLESAHSIAEGPVPWGIFRHIGARFDDALRVEAAAVSVDQLRVAAHGRPVVVAGRNVHRLAGAAELVVGLAETNPVVVVEMGWPSTWRPAGVRAFITTYGGTRANSRAAVEALGLV